MDSLTQIVPGATFGKAVLGNKIGNKHCCLNPLAV